MADLNDLAFISGLDVPRHRLQSGSGSCFASLGDQRFNAVADLGTNTRPVIDTLQVETQALFLAACYRVEKTEPFDVTAVA